MPLLLPLPWPLLLLGIGISRGLPDNISSSSSSSSSETQSDMYDGSRENVTSGEWEIGEDEERLLIHLFRDYNYLILPVRTAKSPPVEVAFGLEMILLINVDERNQILQVNCWLTIQWHDFQLTWDPTEFGNISSLRVPPDRVWLPDIVLFNNADGNYEVSFKSNVYVEANGDVTGMKELNASDVEFFPFDEQICSLVFGSWTYNSDEVRLKWYNNIQSVQLTEYAYSGIWDVLDVPGFLKNNEVTKESRIEFQIIIRRKTLFYTVILIIPTVLMAFLSVMTFYLPADSNEKISLTINLLLALVVFQLLVSKILPPTTNIPLMGRYLLLTFILNVLTIAVTVVIVNVYFRSALTHTMPDWVRRLFLEFLPRILAMRRPERIPIFNGYFVEEYCAAEIFDASLVMPSMTATIVPFMQMANIASNNTAGGGKHHRNCSKSKWKKRLSRKNSTKKRAPLETEEESRLDDDEEFPPMESEEEKISREMKKTVESVAYIAEHMKAEMGDKKVRDDWKYVAMVIDRLLLLVFFGITLGGTVGILLSAPHVFEFVDQEQRIKELQARTYSTTS